MNRKLGRKRDRGLIEMREGDRRLIEREGEQKVRKEEKS